MQRVTVKKGKVTDEDIKEALIESGGIQSAASQWLAAKKGLSISRSGISRRVAKSPELQAACEEATERVLDVAENRLLKMINEGDRTAIIFFLKCKGKSRGYIEGREISSEVRATVKVRNPFDGLDVETLEKLAHYGEDDGSGGNPA